MDFSHREAYRLADAIEQYTNSLNKKVAECLRYQADRIESLTKDLGQSYMADYERRAAEEAHAEQMYIQMGGGYE